MKKYCLALDLKNDAALIAEYERLHIKLRPEIEESIRAAGILNMEIYRVENRMFMIMETEDDFSFERKNALDEANEKVQEWEAFTWKFQQEIPRGKLGEKWRLMERIFSLNEGGGRSEK